MVKESPTHDTEMICIIATGRSGTHALRSLLQQETWITCLDEVLNPELQRKLPGSITEFLDRMLRLMPEWKMNGKTAEALINDYFTYLQNLVLESVPLIDIKDEDLSMLDWPREKQDDRPPFLSQIMDKGYPIIRLTRRNWLAQYASQELARQTNKWVLNKGTKIKNKSTKLKIDPIRILKVLEYFENREKRFHRWLSDYPKIAWLHYEMLLDGYRLSSSARTEIERVVGRSLDPYFSVRTVKQAPPIDQLIENYDEIKVILKGTPYEKFLDAE